jgi:hypothetical protein
MKYNKSPWHVGLFKHYTLLRTQERMNYSEAVAFLSTHHRRSEEVVAVRLEKQEAEFERLQKLTQRLLKATT